MTTQAKPLTADEIGATKQAATWAAEMWPFAPPEIHQTIPRLIATIEQQQEQIEKLKTALKEIKNLKPQKIGETGFQSGPQALLSAAYRIARKALIATEPVNDKR